MGRARLVWLTPIAVPQVALLVASNLGSKREGGGLGGCLRWLQDRPQRRVDVAHAAVTQTLIRGGIA